MKKIIITVLLSFLISEIQAQTMTLQNVIDSIEKNNPVVEMYENEIRSMDEAAKGTRSWMSPTVGVGQFMTPYNTMLWKRNGEMAGMGSVMLSVEQMFPNKGKLDAEENYMKTMSSVEKENKGASINELIQDAKLLYYEWVILQKRISVVNENEKMLDLMIRNAEIRYKNGADKISAYYKAKAALGNTKNMRVMYENDMKEKRIRLNTLMGRNALIPFEIDTAFSFGDYSTMVFDSLLFNETRSDLKSIDRQINLAGLKQKTEEQNLKPEFGIRFDNMYGIGGQPMLYSIMAMAKIPVGWSSKMNKANIKSLKWKAEALSSQKKMMVNEYSGMAYGMRNEFILKKKQMEIYQKDIIPNLRNNFKTMQLGYEQNTEELFMLYDAWEMLNMTQLEYLDILSKAFEMQVTIDRLIQKK